jgi:hypothetical protein
LLSLVGVYRSLPLSKILGRIPAVYLYSKAVLRKGAAQFYFAESWNKATFTTTIAAPMRPISIMYDRSVAGFGLLARIGKGCVSYMTAFEHVH